MTDYIEHRGVSRKTFLIYLLQLPFVAGFAKYLYGFEPKKHYLLNKFSVAGFYFYEGPNILDKMKTGHTLLMKQAPENIEDEYAVELHFNTRHTIPNWYYRFRRGTIWTFFFTKPSILNKY